MDNQDENLLNQIESNPLQNQEEEEDQEEIRRRDEEVSLTINAGTNLIMLFKLLLSWEIWFKTYLTTLILMKLLPARSARLPIL